MCAAEIDGHPTGRPQVRVSLEELKRLRAQGLSWMNCALGLTGGTDNHTASGLVPLARRYRQIRRVQTTY